MRVFKPIKMVEAVEDGESFLFVEPGTNRLIHAESVKCDCGAQGYVNGCGVQVEGTSYAALLAMPFLKTAAVEVGATEDGGVDCDACRSA